MTNRRGASFGGVGVETSFLAHRVTSGSPDGSFAEVGKPLESPVEPYSALLAFEAVTRPRITMRDMIASRGIGGLLSVANRL